MGKNARQMNTRARCLSDLLSTKEKSENTGWQWNGQSRP